MGGKKGGRKRRKKFERLEKSTAVKSRQRRVYIYNAYMCIKRIW